MLASTSQVPWRPNKIEKVKAITRDRIPTKPELKRIVNYADIKCKSLVLFLISSGARIGETLQLKGSDFNFEANPPSVEILEIYTKGEMGGRRAYLVTKQETQF